MYGSSKSFRYDGAQPQTILKVINKTLNIILWSTGSQCNFCNTGVPGDFAPRDFAPRDFAPRGQIPRDLALPARPPFRDLAPPPPPNNTFQRIFLYLDLATKKASEIWFGNLFDNGFARVRLRANVVWYFSCELDFVVSFLILPNLSIVSD